MKFVDTPIASHPNSPNSWTPMKFLRIPGHPSDCADNSRWPIPLTAFRALLEHAPGARMRMVECSSPCRTLVPGGPPSGETDPLATGMHADRGHPSITNT